MSASETFQELRARLGADVVLAPEERDLARHFTDFINKHDPASVPLVGLAFPRSTEEVSEILRICHAAGVKVTPQGGMTGLAAGGIPAETSLVLSLERLRRIEEVDTAAATMTVEAGVVLEAVQNAADAAGFLFPLDLGGRGSCQVGGNASTNAGGNRVLRYGMMRDLVLGVEAVLADGTVVTSLNKMIKNNAGYDVKQLFLGTEGTLGIITRLVLRLHPKPLSVSTGIVAVPDFASLIEFLNRAKRGYGATLSAFETMWPEFYKIGTEELGRVPPLPTTHPLYVLVETMGTDPAADQARFEQVIEEALGDGVVIDAVIAQSGKESQAFWAIRDCPGEFSRVHWPQLSFDISLPIGRIEEYRVECLRRLMERWPAGRAVFFGHIADSNLHLSFKVDQDPMPEHEIDEIVYGLIGEFGGSVSAEHGIGSLKRAYLHHSRTPAELALMRTLKAALDPRGILNPGKVL